MEYDKIREIIEKPLEADALRGLWHDNEASEHKLVLMDGYEKSIVTLCKKDLRKRGNHEESFFDRIR